VPEVIPARGYLVKDIYYYLTPLIPLSFEGEGGVFRRGASPLFDSPLIFTPPEQRERGNNYDTNIFLMG